MALMSRYTCPHCGYEIVAEDSYIVSTMYKAEKQYLDVASRKIVLLDFEEKAPSNLKPWKPSDGCPICGYTLFKGQDYLVD